MVHVVTFNLDYLIGDPYGNYVIQHVLNNGSREEVSLIARCLAGNMLTLSQHKFASNVVERCLEHGTPEERRALVQEVITSDDSGTNPLAVILEEAGGRGGVQ